VIIVTALNHTQYNAAVQTKTGPARHLDQPCTQPSSRVCTLLSLPRASSPMTVSLRGFTSLMGLDAMDGGTASMRKLSAGELDCDDGTDVVLDVLVPLLVLFLMFGMGATVTFQQLKDAAIAQPKALLTGAFCQFGIMPLIAFVLGKITDLSTSLCVLVRNSIVQWPTGCSV